MKRYCFAPIIGTGTSQDSYRSAVGDVPGISISSYIPSNQQLLPLYAFSYDVFATTDLNAVAAISGVYLFPDSGLDNLVSSIHPDEIQQLRNELQLRSIDDTFFGPNERWRTVLYGIGQRMMPGFCFAAFDCGEVTE